MDLQLGRDPREVIEQLEATYALSCQLEDACWKGMSAKVMGLAYAVLGEQEAADSWWRIAARASSRETDAYVWVRADVALAHAQYALEWGDAEVASENARAAIAVAARCGLEDILAGAAAVREALGEVGRGSGAGVEPDAVGALGR